MPRLSTKGGAMPPSPIRKLVPFAERAKAGGITIYHLNIGQPDIETPAGMLDAVRQTKLRVVEYSHSAGNASYREKLCGYYRKHGIEVDPSQVMITTGGSEAIEIALMTCLDEHDEVLIPEPYYANYNGFAIQAGLKVNPVFSSIESGFALPGAEAFEKAITPHTRAVVLCNPSNPTGHLYTAEELESLRRLALKHDLWVIADEVYREFCYDGKPHHSVMRLEGLDQHAVLVDSVSKRYSACGIRIGALVSRNAGVMANALKFAQARLSPPSFGQIAAEAALDTPAEYFEKVIAEYTRRRDFLVDALNRIPGVFCPKPSGAFYCMARLPVDDADRFCQWLLETFEHRNQTVMLAPASGFYSRPGLGRDQVRIAYVLNVGDLRSAVECLAVALEKYPGRVAADKQESSSAVS
jgi:aspartate aminotransferase